MQRFARSATRELPDALGGAAPSMAACSSPIPPALTPAPCATACPAASRPPATSTGTRPARPGTSPSTSAPPPSRSRTRRDDVIAIVDFANERGLRVTAQGTGHNAGAFDTLADTILVKTQEMRGVEIDAEARVARVAAGTLWIEVTEPASALGLAPLAGSSPDVGVVGYYARRRRVVARPQVRPLLQQRRRDRARDRRRRARPRRRRQPRRPLLGAARRRRQLRRRHPHGDLPVPADRGLRRDDVLAVGAQRRGPQGLGRVDADARPTRSPRARA